MPRQHTKLLIIEDNSTYRTALRYALESVDEIECLDDCQSYEAAQPALQSKNTPDVILLDLGLPGKSGLEAITEIRTTLPHTHILVLTQFDDKPKVFQAISEGASGYLLKTSPTEDIIKGIREVMNGGAPLNAQIAKMVLTTFNSSPPSQSETDLTSRESEVLRLLSDGFIKKEIADHLDISYHTVDMHVRNIYRKLQVHNLSGAVAKALKRGLL
ncbi:MAG: response regulator transcription factor [Verrucomicrobiota bacterium]